MANCRHHPAKSATDACVRCSAPLCRACVLTDPDGFVFCSDDCRRDFRAMRANLSGGGVAAQFPRSRKGFAFSPLAALRTLAAGAIVIGATWFALTLLTGSNDPAQWAARLGEQLRTLFKLITRF